LPVDGSPSDFIAAVWGVGTWFGSPLSQNAQGELIGHVLDRPPRTQRRACRAARAASTH
jgi:hypothetical protein